MAHYLERFDHVDVPFMVVETKNMTPFMERIGIELSNHNNSEQKTGVTNHYIDAFQSFKYKDQVLQWLEPEMARYNKLLVDRG